MHLVARQRQDQRIAGLDVRCRADFGRYHDAATLTDRHAYRLHPSHLGIGSDVRNVAQTALGPDHPPKSVWPPTTVSSTAISAIRVAGTDSGSALRTTRSASLPGSSEPRDRSSNDSQALPRVYQASASAGGIACAAPSTPASCVSRVALLQ